MRVAQYYPWVYLKSGVERTILEIAKRSRHEHTILTNHYDPEGTFPEFRSFPVEALDRVSVRRSLGAVATAARTISGRRVDLSRFDAVLVHTDGLGDLFLLRNGHRPCFCFCHTPLRPCFDPEYLARVLERQSGAGRLPFHVARSCFRVADRWLWRRYRHVFFNSEETLRRARQGGLLGAVKERYEVCHPGLDPAEIPQSQTFGDFFLIPGRIMWTKNIEVGLAGFLEMKRAHPEFGRFRLVIAGHVDLKSQPYLARLRQMAADRDDVSFIVSPSDEALRALYRDCYSVMFPAWNEDWGMVPLEANAAGKPVLAARRGGPLDSQVDGATGFLVEPTPEMFASGLSRLAEAPDRVRAMGALARARVHRFDWSLLVRRVDDVLEAGIAADRVPKAQLPGYAMAREGNGA